LWFWIQTSMLCCFRALLLFCILFQFSSGFFSMIHFFISMNHSFSFFLFPFSFFFFFQKQIGGLDSNEQIILANFYNSLTSKGNLASSWNIEYDLCGQTGVTCDSSNPQRVTELYFSPRSLLRFLPPAFLLSFLFQQQSNNRIPSPLFFSNFNENK